jgi:hypothetical protein
LSFGARAVLRGGFLLLQVFRNALRPEFPDDSAYLVLADFGEAVDFPSAHA